MRRDQDEAAELAWLQAEVDKGSVSWRSANSLADDPGRGHSISLRMFEIEMRAAASLDIADMYALSIARFRREVAWDYMDGVHPTLLRLVPHPESEPVFEGVKPRRRELIYRSHRVLYGIDGRTMNIVRTLHSAMNVPGRLRN